MDALHRRSPDAIHAAYLSFFYLSSDVGAEDTMSNTAFSSLQLQMTSDDAFLLRIVLFTANNLLPCLDRLRLTEALLSVFGNRSSLLVDRANCHHMLSILLNMSIFSNMHSVLLDSGVASLINKAVDVLCCNSIEVEPTDRDYGGYSSDKAIVTNIISNLLSQAAEYSQAVKNGELTHTFLRLLALHDGTTTADIIHSIALQSSSAALVIGVCNSELIKAVSASVTSEFLTESMAWDAARYFLNISKPGVMDPATLFTAGAASAALTLSERSSHATQTVAIASLLNMLTVPRSCEELVEEAVLPLLNLVLCAEVPASVSEYPTAFSFSALESTRCLFNLSCVPYCVDILVKRAVHVKLLVVLGKGSQLLLFRLAVLSVLVQLSSSRACMEDLVSMDVIGVLDSQVVLNRSAAGNTTEEKEMASCFAHEVSKVVLSLSMHRIQLFEGHRKELVVLLNRLSSCRGPFFEDIVSKCAIVLAFLSLSNTDFGDLERVLRVSMEITHSDVVMESTAIALFNIVSSSRNVDMLLKDGIYLNVMVRLMRTGNIRVQESIAQAMRNLSAVPRSAELLLQLDLLSDFIVVALLRTSSDGVKAVSCDTFFNLFGHDSTRLKLAKSDLWWAMIRLTRTDVREVRSVAVHTLFNLSTYEECMHSLRNNFVFVFVKEILSYDQPEYFDLSIRSLMNVVSKCSADLTVAERVALVRTCVEAFYRSSSATGFLNVLSLMRKAAQLCGGGEEVAEYVAADVITALTQTKQIWIDDDPCRLFVSQLLCRVARFESYTRSVPLTEMGALCELVMPLSRGLPRRDAVDHENTSLPDSTLESICFRLLTVFLYYVRSDSSNAVATHLMSLSCLHHILQLLFHPGDESFDLSPACKEVALAVFAHVVKALVDPKKNTVGSAATWLAEVQTISLVRLVLSDLAAGSVTTSNIMSLIYDCSLSLQLSAALLANAPRIVEVLNKIILRHSEEDLSFEFAACVLRNFSLHTNLRDLLINCKGIDTLIRNILGSTSTQAILDATLMLYNITKYELSNDSTLCPQTIMLLASSVCETVIDPSVTVVARLVIGLVLDRYSTDMGYDASFVQSMLAEISTHPEEVGTDVEESLLSSDMRGMTLPALVPEVIRDDCYEELFTLSEFPLQENAWRPRVLRDVKGIEVSLQFPVSSASLTCLEAMPVEPRPVSLYRKIRRNFPLISLCSTADGIEPEDSVCGSEWSSPGKQLFPLSGDAPTPSSARSPTRSVRERFITFKEEDS